MLVPVETVLTYNDCNAAMRTFMNERLSSSNITTLEASASGEDDSYNTTRNEVWVGQSTIQLSRLAGIVTYT
jgi:hypothetical protein